MKRLRMAVWGLGLPAAAMICAPALALAQATVPSYVEAATGNTKAGIGISILPASSTSTPSTDASGTVTAGGTYQTVLASSTSRKGCLIQNPTTATEVLNVKVGTMASPFTIPIGGTFSCGTYGSVVVTDAITVTAATTSHAFTAVSQ